MSWRGEVWSGRRGSNPRPTAWKAVTLPLSYSRLRSLTSAELRRGSPAYSPAHLLGPPASRSSSLSSTNPRRHWLARRSSPAVHRRAKEGGEGRTRTFEAARATDLQSAAFDRFATSPRICLIGIRVFDAYCVYCLFLSVFVAFRFVRFRGSEFRMRLPAASGLELAKGFEPPTC